MKIHVCHGPHTHSDLSEEQREIVRKEWERGEALVASMLASQFIERNRHPEPPLCSRPDCENGTVTVRDEAGDLWREPCPMCRANERWRVKYGY